MYSYSGRGWKSTPGSSSSSSCSAGQSPVIAAAASPDRCCSKSIAEDEDEVDINSEEKDVAAPLPTSNETSAASSSRHMKTKNTSAKDKRRLREKRRSTGVASLSAGQEADEETTRNTSFNETAAAAAAAAAAASPDGLLEHHKAQNISSQSMIASDDAMTTQQSQQPILSHNNGSVTHHKSTEITSDHQTSVQSLSIHDDTQVPFSACARTADVTPNTYHVTTTSSNFTKNLCARPFEAKRSILKGGGSRPVTAAKPAAYTYVAGGGSVSASNTSTNHCQSSNEDARMLVRIGELEKLLECERRENGLMKQMLSKKDCRIRDLEINIAALNEDLDLADEDYLRLEEENRALGRALAQLSSTNATD